MTTRYLVVGLLLFLVKVFGSAVEQDASTDLGNWQTASEVPWIFEEAFSTGNGCSFNQLCTQVNNAFGTNVKLRCSVASAPLPAAQAITLPLFYQGNYDLCNTFKEAHYCTIRAGPLGIPLGKETFFPVGDFRYSQCVPTSCSGEELSELFLKSVDRTAWRLILRFHPTIKDSAELVALMKILSAEIKASLSVECITSEENANRTKIDSAGIGTLIFIAIMMGAVVCSTIYHVYFIGNLDEANLDSANGKSYACIKWFSSKHNLERLTVAIPGDYNAFNGIRVLSMAWIIMGHCILNFVMPPVVNLTAEQRFLESVQFAFVSGAEYSVDTFFFMSGFLAAFGLVKKLKQSSENFISLREYVLLVLARYLRLTPVYAVVMLLYWKVLPTFGNGPLWNEGMDGMLSAGVCDDYWWTNMLYINNLVPFGLKGGMCMGWSWYLANDFQFFLLAPIIVSVHLLGVRRRSAILKWTPLILPIIAQLVAVPVTMYSRNLMGKQFMEVDFFQYLYAAPWTRCTPYMVGMMLALWLNGKGKGNGYELASIDEFADSNGTGRSGNKHRSYLLRNSLFVAALGTMLGLILLHADSWVCRDGDENCNAWSGMYAYGFFVLQNWNQLESVLYFTLGWLVWSVGFAVIAYSLFTGVDPFRVGWILSHSAFTPLARLTFNAYLVHLPLMILHHASSPYLPVFSTMGIMSETVFFVVVAYICSFLLYMFVEKPIMNIVTAGFMLLRKPKRGNSVMERYQSLQRSMSVVSDVDSEAIHLSSQTHEDDNNLGSIQNGDQYRPLNS